MNIYGVIPARGGSKGIPDKNIRDFSGKPLLVWTIEQLRNSGVDQVFVSSDSSEIGRVAEISGAHFLLRPPELSTDSAQSEAALLHAAAEIGMHDEDGLLFAQATSPLRRVDDLKDAIRRFEIDPSCSLFSAIRQDDLTGWIEREGKLEIFPDVLKEGRTARQVRPAAYVETGSFYITSIGSLITSKSRLGRSFLPFEVPGWTLHELDHLTDWSWMEKIMRLLVLEKEE